MSATGMNRREFIKKTAATGLVLAGTATLAGCGLGSGGESIKWSEEADIVIIGSGFAGLAAALEATEAGAKVKIIEKNAYSGRKLHYKWWRHGCCRLQNAGGNGH